MTPIDWKLGGSLSLFDSKNQGHHSLVTPIHWKRSPFARMIAMMIDRCHHSLVTPIDWKPDLTTSWTVTTTTASPLAGDTY